MDRVTPERITVAAEQAATKAFGYRLLHKQRLEKQQILQAGITDMDKMARNTAVQFKLQAPGLLTKHDPATALELQKRTDVLIDNYRIGLQQVLAECNNAYAKAIKLEEKQVHEEMRAQVHEFGKIWYVTLTNTDLELNYHQIRTPGPNTTLNAAMRQLKSWYDDSESRYARKLKVLEDDHLVKQVSAKMDRNDKLRKAQEATDVEVELSNDEKVAQLVAREIEKKMRPLITKVNKLKINGNAGNEKASQKTVTGKKPKKQQPKAKQPQNREAGNAKAAGPKPNNAAGRQQRQPGAGQRKKNGAKRNAASPRQSGTNNKRRKN